MNSKIKTAVWKLRKMDCWAASFLMFQKKDTHLFSLLYFSFFFFILKINKHHFVFRFLLNYQQQKNCFGDLMIELCKILGLIGCLVYYFWNFLLLSTLNSLSTSWLIIIVVVISSSSSTTFSTWVKWGFIKDIKIFSALFIEVCSGSWSG